MSVSTKLPVFFALTSLATVLAIEGLRQGGAKEGDVRSREVARVEENASVTAGCSTNLTSSVPAHNQSLWRSGKNIVRLTFDLLLTPLAPVSVSIRELLPGGAFGPNLSAGFTFTIEGTNVLKIQETGTTLQHRKWYGISDNGGEFCTFEVDLLLQVGDTNNNGQVTAADVANVNAFIPCVFQCGDANRQDVNGDERVLNGDTSIVYSKIPSSPVPKPTGHP